MRCAVIARHVGEFPVRLMCRVLQVSPAEFYAYRRRPASWRLLMDEVLLTQVRIAFRESGGTDGAPRIERELRAAELGTSTKRVARLMREGGLVARPKTCGRVRTTDTPHDDPIAPNRLGRQFSVDGVAVNTIWVGDITYVPNREGFVYLSTVLDLASRRCVGWAMRDTLEVEAMLSALRMAREARRPAPGARPDLSLRPRQSIRVGGVPRRAGGPRHAGEHERNGQLLRQRGRRELLRDPRVRADHAERLAHPRRGAASDLSLHRNVVQPETATYDARLRQSSRV
jgi:hypothetical protein